MQTMPPGGAPPVAGPGWSGVALDRGRGLGATLARLGFAVVLIFEVVASGMLIGANVGTGTMPAESMFHLWAWQYDYGPVITTYGHAPSLVFVFALIGLIALGGTMTPANAVRKAKGRAMATKWSYPEERAHLGHDLSALGYSGLFKSGFRIRLGIAAFSAVVLVGLGLLGPSEPGFTAGLGPTVVFVSAGVAVIGVLLARPWEVATRLTVAPDGRLFVGGAGVPLTPVGVAVPPPPPAPALSPPGWFPDPSGQHQLRYWDGTRWASQVSDSGTVSEDEVLGAA